MKKTTSGSYIKKRGETQFRQNKEEKRKNRLSESTVFYQSKRRSGRKEEKTEKARRRDALVNNGTKSSFSKRRQTAKSRSYCKFPIRMCFGCEPDLHQNRPIFMYRLFGPGRETADAEVTHPVN